MYCFIACLIRCTAFLDISVYWRTTSALLLLLLLLLLLSLSHYCFNLLCRSAEFLHCLYAPADPGFAKGAGRPWRTQSASL